MHSRATRTSLWMSFIEKAFCFFRCSRGVFVAQEFHQPLFDEPMQIPQSSRPYMNMFRILLVLACTAVLGAAQTNSLSLTNTAGPARRLTLQECVELALTNNFQLQIERYNPQIALYAVSGAYGGYDPILNMSGQHDHRESGRQIVAGGFQVPGAISDDESFSGGLTGLFL